MSERILVFPGSFNPFHKLHRYVLDEAVRIVAPDRIVFCIVSDNSACSIKVCHKKNIIEIELGNYHCNFIVEDFGCITQNNDIKKSDLIAKIIAGFSCNDHIYCVLNSVEYLEAKCVVRNDTNFVIYGQSMEVMNKISNNDSFIKVPEHLATIDEKAIRYKEIDYDNCEFTTDWLHIHPIEIDIDKLDVSCSVNKYINDNGLYAIHRLQNMKISQKRISHIVSTANYAKSLVEMNFNDSVIAQDAFVAGIYHDIAKEIDKDIQRRIAERIGITNYGDPNLLHAYIGSNIIRTVYNFDNSCVLIAINRHTKPYDYYSTQPDTLAKILYVADKLEPMRNTKNMLGMDIDGYRKLAERDIEKCFLAVYEDLCSRIGS